MVSTDGRGHLQWANVEMSKSNLGTYVRDNEVKVLGMYVMNG